MTIGSVRLRSVGRWKPYNEKGEPFGSPSPRDPAIIRVMAKGVTSTHDRHINRGCSSAIHPHLTTSVPAETQPPC